MSNLLLSHTGIYAGLVLLATSLRNGQVACDLTSAGIWKLAFRAPELD
jgi:hypothetical protein